MQLKSVNTTQGLPGKKEKIDKYIICNVDYLRINDKTLRKLGHDLSCQN